MALGKVLTALERKHETSFPDLSSITHMLPSLVLGPQSHVLPHWFIQTLQIMTAFHGSMGKKKKPIEGQLQAA
jgi:hypothetical protein